MSFQKSRRRALVFFGLAGLGFLAAQFIRPALVNPPVVADIEAPAQVKRILRNSCYDCHSNETKLAWFDRIEPGYWLVAHDVILAREHMNFSDFGNLPKAQQRSFLYEGVNRIRYGIMPPKSYSSLHAGTSVTPADLETLEKYLSPNEDARTVFPSTPAPSQVAPGSFSGPVKAALNGITFFSGYRDWKLVSATDRFDNDTIRVVLGNDVAIQAIADGKIRPWPDGAVFAKVAWKKSRVPGGTVLPGDFAQVEFMEKGANKYATTEGWGFARWRGAALTPYGKDENFAEECTSCHSPMKKRDFVFTDPIGAGPEGSDLFNASAALPKDLPVDLTKWTVVTASIDPRDGSMSVQFGNDSAVAHARSGSGESYPAGSVVALVTWRQKEDPNWFGARIPGQLKSVEIVTADPKSPGGSGFDYKAYPAGSAGPDADARTRSILTMGSANFR